MKQSRVSKIRRRLMELEFYYYNRAKDTEIIQKFLVTIQNCCLFVIEV